MEIELRRIHIIHACLPVSKTEQIMLNNDTELKTMVLVSEIMLLSIHWYSQMMDSYTFESTKGTT